MTSPRSSRYRVLVSGRLSRTVTDILADRFGPAAAVVEADESRTVVDIDADQASLRALLTLLWDVGHDVPLFARWDDLREQSDD